MIETLSFFENEYLNALIVFAGFFVLAKIFHFISEKFFMSMAKKTKTLLDDKIIERSRGPISIILIIVGFLLGFKMISMPENIRSLGTRMVTTLIVFFVTLLITRIINTVIKVWGKEWARRTKSKADDQIVAFGTKFINITGWALGIVYGLTVWNIEIGPLVASLGVAGVAVAFALQQSLGNIFGGVSMIVDRTIHIDDVIELGDGTSGTVIDVGLRTTKIRTWDNEVLIIPNGELANDRIKNIVLPNPKVRVVIPFGVAYGSDIDKVKKIVLKELRKVKGFISDPKPFIKFLEMGDSSLNFKAYFWVERYDMRFNARDEANTLIYNALNKNKIEIPFPQMDVHMKK